jgi:nitrous oxide reductase accessory protein NosL
MEEAMSKKGKAAALALSLLFLVAIAAGGYWLLQETQAKTCPICARSIHPHSSAMVLIDKKPVKVCCIRCGITHNFQVGKPGEVVEVTDFLSDRPMKPDAAYYVEGSQVSMCDPHESGLIDQTKHPYSRIFDRCEPSTYAFAHRKDAEAFVHQSGGKLLTWDELKKEVGVQQ